MILNNKRERDRRRQQELMLSRKKRGKTTGTVDSLVGEALWGLL